MGYSASVSDHIETLVSGLEVFVDLDFHVVELDLHAVQQGIVIGGSRGNAVECIDHFDDAVEDSLGKYQ